MVLVQLNLGLVPTGPTLAQPRHGPGQAMTWSCPGYAPSLRAQALGHMTHSCI